MSILSNGPSRFLYIFASIIILVAGLKSAASLILPFLMAVLISLISMPLLDWLRARRVPATLAALLTILADVIVLASLVFVVSTSVQSFTAAAPQYQARLQHLAATSIAQFADWGFIVSEKDLGKIVDAGIALDLVARTMRGAVSILSNFFLVFLTIIFILLEAVDLRAKLETAFGTEIGLQRMESVRKRILRYLGIKTLTSLLTGILVWIGLAIVGVDFAVLWGLLAFLLNYVPNLGSILAAVPPVLLAVVQFGMGRALIVAIVFLLINVSVGTFLEPKLLGRGLGLSTLVVFLSLVFWGWVWGPVGMLLSVPLTMIVKIILENSSNLQWVAVLMGTKPE